MIVSFRNLDSTTQRIKVKITTNHAASSDREPVIVLPDGRALDLASWVAMG